MQKWLIRVEDFGGAPLECTTGGGGLRQRGTGLVGTVCRTLLVLIGWPRPSWLWAATENMETAEIGNIRLIQPLRQTVAMPRQLHCARNVVAVG